MSMDTKNDFFKHLRQWGKPIECKASFVKQNYLDAN